ncbi:MAG TPA: helicase-related protein, partial [Candidatus Saccharibacteria bacterium]|nr:helicase-related protein [Candidatus Saccharibacteria bacterium]
DNKDNESAHALYDQLYRGDIDIIIGTQVIAKGLDLPYLRFVGVVQADTGLMLPDFASTERTFQLISQVIGRVGRSSH